MFTYLLTSSGWFATATLFLLTGKFSPSSHSHKQLLGTLIDGSAGQAANAAGPKPVLLLWGVLSQECPCSALDPLRVSVLTGEGEIYISALDNRNSFTATACNISGLKCLQTVYFLVL